MVLTYEAFIIQKVMANQRTSRKQRYRVSEHAALGS